jgi:hypothetical protein
VRVPEEAAPGKAKLTFSFDAWQEATVAPTTIDLPVRKKETVTTPKSK